MLMIAHSINSFSLTACFPWGPRATMGKTRTLEHLNYAQVGSSFSHVRFKLHANRLFVLAHTGSGWGRSRESCSGPFHAWQCRRWPLLSLFFAASRPHLNFPLPTISLCTINRVSVSLAFLCVCACSVTIPVLFVFLFTYALSCILGSFNCTILFLLYTAPFDTLYLLVIAFDF